MWSRRFGALILLILAVSFASCWMPANHNSCQFLLNIHPEFPTICRNFVIAFIVLIATVFSIYHLYIKQLSGSCGWKKTMSALVFASIVSACIVISLQGVSGSLRDTIKGRIKNHEQHKTSLSGNIDISGTNSTDALESLLTLGQLTDEIISFTSSGLEIFWHYRIAQGKPGYVIYGCAGLLFVMGGGYLFSRSAATFPAHLMSFVVGVALSEEVGKAVVGLWLYQYFLRRWAASLQTAFLCAFAIAGLGFGIGECFFYFQFYGDNHCGLFDYLLRVLWCVPLHMAWTVIAGSIAWRMQLNNFALHFPPNLINSTLALLISVSPGMVLHGCYDALGCHNSRIMWSIGIGSFCVAHSCIRRVINPPGRSTFLDLQGNTP